MKKSNLYLYLCLFIVLLAVPIIQQVEPQVVSTSTNQAPNKEAEQLVQAYPEFLIANPYDSNAIIWRKDNTRMRFDDGVIGKDFERMQSEPDLEDQMAMLYEPGDSFTIHKDYDPGRIRFEPFFKKMYGATEAEVRANLETIYWLPSSSNKPLLVTRINGVSQKLQAISNELDLLVQQPDHRYLLKYLKDPGGTFNWRDVADTNRLSTHSFGIAIDINSAYSDYWKWSADGGVKYRNQIPMEIVKIFEKYGFIWGGKWYHYDTMHFEYRPELLVRQ